MHHSWLFPIIVLAAVCTSAFQAITGTRIGVGWPRNPTYVRASGALGVAIGVVLLALWLVGTLP